LIKINNDLYRTEPARREGLPPALPSIQEAIVAERRSDVVSISAVLARRATPQRPATLASWRARSDQARSGWNPVTATTAIEQRLAAVLGVERAGALICDAGRKSL
jgi:hypothetical protein